MPRCNFRRREDGSAPPHRLARFSGKCLAALKRHRSNLTALIKSKPESMFLSRLPVEIRLLIYEYVCRSLKGYIFITNSQSTKSSSFMFQPKFPFLQTCRQIYQEGADAVRWSRTFIVVGPAAWHPIHNGRIVPLVPDRFDSIVHLETSFVFNHIVRDRYLFGIYRDETNTECWEQVWAMIVASRKLKSLKIEILYNGPLAGMSVDANWLKPLTQIRGIKDLEIDIKYPKLECHGRRVNEDLYEIMSQKKSKSAS